MKIDCYDLKSKAQLKMFKNSTKLMKSFDTNFKHSVGSSNFEGLFKAQSGDDDSGLDEGDDRGAVVIATAKPKSVTKRPNFYQVILHNDDYTPMDFVVDVLRDIFKKSLQEATEIMLQVHTKGKGICGKYPYGIAETKAAQVVERARVNKHPLKCTFEKTS